MFSAIKTGFNYYSAAPSGDPYWNNVILLNNWETPQTAFIDGSSNNLAVTRGNNPRTNLRTPFSGTGGSLNFVAGSLQYISVPDNASFYFTGDFTVEAWVYLTTQSIIRSVVGQWPGVSATNCAWTMDVHSTNNLYFGYGIGSTNAYATSTLNVPINQWVHCAVARSGTSLKIFVNGVASPSITVSGALNNSTGTCNIGRKGDNSHYCTGFISNVRVVNGTALYTANFTPPTSPLTAVSGTGLLVTATGTGMQTGAATTSVIDTSPGIRTVNVNGTSYVSGLSPFGNTYPGSVYMSQALSSYLTSTSYNGYTYGTGDFTIECWIRLTSTGVQQYIIDQRNSGTATAIIPTLYVDSTNVLIYYVNGAVVITGASTLTTGIWYHVAVARTGTSTKMFLNGTQEGSTYSDSNNYVASRVSISTNGATNGSNILSGYVSNVRLSKGFCYYTTTFTPSTTPLISDPSYTSFLTCTSTMGVYDVSNNGTQMNLNSDAITTGSQKKFGTSSGSFSASPMEYIDSANIRFGTGDFTIEGWVYRNVAGTAHGLVAKGVLSTGWLLSVNTSNQLSWTSGATVTVSTTTIPATTWTYFAIVRSGSTMYMFINGTQEGSTWTDSSDFNQTSSLYLGSVRNGTSILNGYLDDVRITKGIARYTATFTVPTSAFPTS